MAVKLRQEQQAHLAAPVLEPSVLVLVLQVQVAVWLPTRLAVRAELVLALLVLALLVLALQALPAALVQLARRELQVQEELLVRMALGERLVQLARQELQVQEELLAWRELQEPGVRPERERSGQQPWW